MAWLLIWLGSAFVCSIVAGNKRRSALAWFIVGALLGPLALIIALCVGEAGNPCPYCKKTVDPAATKCPYCQSEVTPTFSTQRNKPKGPVSLTGRIVGGIGVAVMLCSVVYLQIAWGIERTITYGAAFVGLAMLLYGINIREALPESET